MDCRRICRIIRDLSRMRRASRRRKPAFSSVFRPLQILLFWLKRQRNGKKWKVLSQRLAQSPNLDRGQEVKLPSPRTQRRSCSIVGLIVQLPDALSRAFRSAELAVDGV